jgi:hypothetical protein
MFLRNVCVCLRVHTALTTLMTDIYKKSACFFFWNPYCSQNAAIDPVVSQLNPVILR